MAIRKGIKKKRKGKGKGKFVFVFCFEGEKRCESKESKGFRVWCVGKLVLVGKTCVHLKPRPCLLVPHFNSISLISSSSALHFLFLNFPILYPFFTLSYANPSFPTLPIIYTIHSHYSPSIACTPLLCYLNNHTLQLHIHTCIQT